MRRRILPAVVAGIVLPLAIGMGTTNIQAQSATAPRVHTHQAPVRGVLTATSNQTLHVQTQSGNVSIPYSTSTHVLRMVTGSTADLVVGAHVDIHVATGTTTAQAFTVSPAHAAHTTHVSHHAVGTAKPTHHAWTGSKSLKHSTQPARHGGVIVAVSANTVTIGEKHGGTTTTYTLSSSVTVSKVMNGTVSDLAAGQTVLVFRNSTGAAAAVDILQS
ncbi:MAG: hypothetical protein ACR2GA_03450 [Chloroflexota bacterium]